MIFRCCGGPSLSVLMNLKERGVPHGVAGHDVVHDYVRVLRCGACGGGVVESHSHDCWDIGDHSSWDMYWWWRIDPADMGGVSEMAAMCPSPLDPGCGCRVHEGLGRTPPRAARSVESPYDEAPLPEVRAGMEDGVPRWI